MDSYISLKEEVLNQVNKLSIKSLSAAELQYYFSIFVKKANS